MPGPGEPRDRGGKLVSERVGALIAVMVVVAILLTVNQGVGDAALERVKGAWCSIAGGGCPADLRVPNPYVPKGPCTRSSPETVIDATLVPVAIPGRAMDAVRIARSDGSVAVTLKAGSGAPGRSGLAPKALDLGRTDLGEGARGEVAADARGAGARTWVFGGAGEADQFIDEVQQWAQESITARSLRLTGGGLGPAFEAGYRVFIARRTDFSLPPPTKTYFEGGLREQNVAGISPATPYVSIDGRLSAPDAGVVDHQSGRVTLVYRLPITAEASPILHEIGGGASSGDAPLIAALTIDPAGNPVRLTVSGNGHSSGPLGAAPGWQSLRAAARGLAEVTAGNETWELEAGLDLGDGRTSSVAVDWLRAALAGSTPETSSHLADASRALVGTLDEDAVLVLKEYGPGEEPFGSGIETLRVGAGAYGGFPRTVSEIERARYRPPGGGGFVDVPGCGG
jgi:hypothetical protein